MSKVKLLSPHEWFCSKFGIDILEERLSEREHDGYGAIRFIEQYLEYLKTGKL